MDGRLGDSTALCWATVGMPVHGKTMQSTESHQNRGIFVLLTNTCFARVCFNPFSTFFPSLLAIAILKVLPGCHFHTRHFNSLFHLFHSGLLTKDGVILQLPLGRPHGCNFCHWRSQFGHLRLSKANARCFSNTIAKHIPTHCPVVISRHHSHQRHHYQNHHHHLQCDQIAISSLFLSPPPSPGPSPVISPFTMTFPHLPNPSHSSGHLSGSCNLCHR